MRAPARQRHAALDADQPSGRQTPRRVCDRPVAPSAVPLALPESAFAHPRAMTAEEVADLPRRFAHAARVAHETGFTGVQVHAAHGTCSASS